MLTYADACEALAQSHKRISKSSRSISKTKQELEAAVQRGDKEEELKLRLSLGNSYKKRVMSLASETKQSGTSSVRPHTLLKASYISSLRPPTLVA